MYQNFRIVLFHISLFRVASTFLLFSVTHIFATPGDLDPTFNIAGIPAGTVATIITGQGFGGSDVNSVAIQADNKIVVAGTAYIGGQYRFALARYLVNGALDEDFGAHGMVTTTIIGQTGNSGGYSVAIQTDGKIVVAGYVDIGGPSQFAVARFDENGVLDGTFGSGGTVAATITGQTGSNSSAGHSVAIQEDGKIVVAGYVSIGGKLRFAVARFGTNGTLDWGFGSGGTISTMIAEQTGVSFGNSVAIHEDKKIVVAGYADIDGQFRFAVARFGTNGTIDGGFGSGGTITTTIAGQTGSETSAGYSVAIQKDEKIVVAGDADIDGQFRFAVARFDTNGAIDNSFGSGGTVTTTITGQTVGSSGYSVAIQANGKIVVAGYADIGGKYKFAVARFCANGTLDRSFGLGGTVATTITGQTGGSSSNSVAIQTDGKIVLAGESADDNGNQFAVARFMGDIIVTNLCASRLIEKYGLRLALASFG